MAKYLYTSGKRKGKVYQEFYYTLNGQQIVNKKSFYCPVNTKWLSKEEFKQYILQLIENEYPNYLVVDELPEEPQNHIIYFLKQVNEDQSIYYDVYVYDNEELKQITFKGGDSGDLAYVKKVCDYITSKCLSGIYDHTLVAYQNVVTNGSGKLTTAEIPHLYLHHYHGHNTQYGEMNFVIYTTISTQLTNEQLGDYLTSLNCTSYFNLYPANGSYIPDKIQMQGIYTLKTGSGIAPYSMFICGFTGSYWRIVNFSTYSANSSYKIVQIF